MWSEQDVLQCGAFPHLHELNAVLAAGWPSGGRCGEKPHGVFLILCSANLGAVRHQWHFGSGNEAEWHADINFSIRGSGRDAKFQS